MLEAAKAALEKAGFTIESLRNRIKELEAENAKLKEQKTCATCQYCDYTSGLKAWCDTIDCSVAPHTFGCFLHEPKA